MVSTDLVTVSYSPVAVTHHPKIVTDYSVVETLYRDAVTIQFCICRSYAARYCQYDRCCIDCTWVGQAFVGVALAAK